MVDKETREVAKGLTIRQEWLLMFLYRAYKRKGNVLNHALIRMGVAWTKGKGVTTGFMLLSGGRIMELLNAKVVDSLTSKGLISPLDGRFGLEAGLTRLGIAVAEERVRLHNAQERRQQRKRRLRLERRRS